MMAASIASDSQAEQRERLEELKHTKPDEQLRAAGYSYTEISQQTGFTHTKINRSLTQGRARLRQREALIQRATQQRIDSNRPIAEDPQVELPVSSELERRRQRIARSQQLSEVELDMEIDR